ncbi:MAG: 30S ribosomal protein S4 [Patescibacteria group bacterium]|nr:30S ribosomal protein S4 [Patescibacteria group bacterium]
MGRNLDAKCKQCRRTGEKLFLKGERCSSAKCAIIKRNYPPGFHSLKGKKRVSGYGSQLNEKQKARRQYQLTEKQFRLTFYKARQQSGNSGDNFIKLLETRLDNAIYRLGIGESRSQARQIISHGHIVVNDIKVSIPSYILKPGDIIKIKPQKKQLKLFKNLGEKLKNKETPAWLYLDQKDLSAKILHQPDISGMNFNFDIQMIIEFYSR